MKLFGKQCKKSPQTQAGTSKSEWGKQNGSYPYGDDPKDQKSIKLGMNFYRRVHSQIKKQGY